VRKNQTKMEASAGIPLVCTEEKEDRFIELWRETQCLYDISSKAYSNRCTKNRALKDIAEKLQLTGIHIHFTSISNYFRVIHDFFAFFMSHVTETLDDFTDRKWRHQPTCRPWFPISVQYMFCVSCVPFASFLRVLRRQ
jgi:hypothetical protein